MGSWLARPCSEILAGTEANSGVLANVQRRSTASKRGLVASAHLCLFPSVYLGSRLFIYIRKKNTNLKSVEKKVKLKSIEKQRFIC